MNLYKIGVSIVLLLIISYGLLIYYKSTIETPWIFDIPNPLDSISADNAETGPVSSSSMNEFAINLYKQLSAENTTQNIFYSPYSISTAVAMAYEGSSGNTANEIKEVFGYETDISTHRANSYNLYRKINSKKSDVTLSTVNAIWIEKSFSLLPEYQSNVSKYYGGVAVNLDFKSQKEKARLSINSWVEDRTSNKIKNILPPGSVDDETKVVITNAIYFKGKWKSAFKKDETKEMPFYISGNKSAPVQMMYQDGESTYFKYGKTDNIEILELPYKGDNMIMTIFLPKRDKLDELESSLTYSNIQKWRSSIFAQDVVIFLPKFNFDTSYSLVNTLRGMGINEAFSNSSANFSGMTELRQLYIQNIFHKAFIDVYEEGTEAASSTAVSMSVIGLAPGQAPKPVFKADHPFLFMITEKETDTILFMGKVYKIN